MSARSHTCVCGPIIVAALQTYAPAEDAPDDAQIREAFARCHASGLALLRSGAVVKGEWLQGSAEREAEAVLDLLGVEDAPASLTAALVAEFISAYRAH